MGGGGDNDHCDDVGVKVVVCVVRQMMMMMMIEVRAGVANGNERNWKEAMVVTHTIFPSLVTGIIIINNMINMIVITEIIMMMIVNMVFSYRSRCCIKFTTLLHLRIMQTTMDATRTNVIIVIVIFFIGNIMLI